MKYECGVPLIEGFKLIRSDGGKTGFCACGCGFPVRNGWKLRKFHSLERPITFEQEAEYARWALAAGIIMKINHLDIMKVKK